MHVHDGYTNTRKGHLLKPAEWDKTPKMLHAKHLKFTLGKKSIFAAVTHIHMGKYKKCMCIVL